jgi:hypothetical protein
MKKNIIILIYLISSVTLFGNDGIYLTHGGIIFPSTETKISLEREILSFTVDNKVCKVNILFDFYNPEDIERKLLVGFQAPTPVGGVSREMCMEPGIKDFIVMKEDEIIPYKLMAAKCEDCELKDTSDFVFSQQETGVYVYLFEVTFKPGLNKINHSYNFPSSTRVAIDQLYRYILKTGSKWAGGIIKDLTININTGDNSFFYVNNIFGEHAKWEVVGSGKISDARADNLYTYLNSKFVRVLSGYLQINVKEFSPEENIEFGLMNGNSLINWNTDMPKIKNEEILFSIIDLKLKSDYNYSEEELLIMRNAIFAQHNYLFKLKKLMDYFSQFDWYMPDPNIKAEQIILTEKEKNFINEIIKLENK